MVDESVYKAIATAYHEAGHAVMALSFGCPIKKVTIVPGRSWLGQYRLGVCELQKGRSGNAKNLLDDEIVILFAGMVAEAHFTGRYCESGAAEDLRTIRRLLCRRRRRYDSRCVISCTSIVHPWRAAYVIRVGGIR